MSAQLTALRDLVYALHRDQAQCQLVLAGVPAELLKDAEYLPEQELRDRLANQAASIAQMMSDRTQLLGERTQQRKELEEARLALEQRDAEIRQLKQRIWGHEATIDQLKLVIDVRDRALNQQKEQP